MAPRRLPMLLGLIVALVALAPVRAQEQPLRAVNWETALAKVNGVTLLDASHCAGAANASGPCAFVQLPRAASLSDPLNGVATSEALSGYLNLRDPLYGDLDGDGRDEAVLRIESGGTAGAAGFIVLAATADGPRLVTGLGAARLAATALDGGALSTSHVWFAGYEATCCPSARIETAFALRGDTLEVVSQTVLTGGSEERVVSPQEATVLAFYRAISNKRFDIAYGFLSPRQQAAEPFATWAEGFAALAALGVATSAGAADGEVLVELAATERLPDGEPHEQRLRGSWRVIANPDFSPTPNVAGLERRPAWLLEDAAIQPV